MAAGCFEAAAHDLRELLRLKGGRSANPSAAILDGRVPCSTPESGHRAGYGGAKRTKVAKVHLAVDTLGCFLAIHVTPADVDERKAVGEPARGIQEATGEAAAQAAREHGIELEVVRMPEAKRGF